MVIDEFPYLLGHSPELPSVLQRFLDNSRTGPDSIRLVLCGSALAVMARLLEGSQALRGRATLDMMVRPFDYRTTAAFWGIDDPKTASLVHSVVGGSPGYRDLIPGQPPTSPESFAHWLSGGPLNPSSAAFREDAYLLAEERSINDRQLYHSVLTAIAGGAATQAAIAQVLDRPSAGVQHPLAALAEAGFIVALDDAFRARRPIYRIADAIVRFHQVVTRRDLARFEDRRTLEARNDACHCFSAHVSGPHFAQLAREFTLRFAQLSTVGGAVTAVAPAVVNDARGRQQYEVDVVVLGIDDTGATVVRALGEAERTQAARTISDVERLEHVRGLVAVKQPSAVHARLLLFSAGGFQATLTAAADQRTDVELIDLQRLYVGG